AAVYLTSLSPPPLLSPSFPYTTLFRFQSGADELVFYDITASSEGRRLFTDVLQEVASRIFIPLTVGGGIASLEDFDRVLKAGARSEEHTSELQSRFDLVCRLLLEKKK